MDGPLKIYFEKFSLVQIFLYIIVWSLKEISCLVLEKDGHWYNHEFLTNIFFNSSNKLSILNILSRALEYLIFFYIIINFFYIILFLIIFSREL